MGTGNSMLDYGSKNDPSEPEYNKESSWGYTPPQAKCCECEEVVQNYYPKEGYYYCHDCKKRLFCDVCGQKAEKLYMGLCQECISVSYEHCDCGTIVEKDGLCKKCRQEEHNTEGK